MKNDQINIVDCMIFNGRNIFSHKPVMKMVVDIGQYGDIPTKDIPGFNENLVRVLPGLKRNCCSLGYPGGFLERLSEGTYLAHVLEHVILEMQFMLGYNVSFGKTRTIRPPSLLYLVYEFANEVCGLECGKGAVFVLNMLLGGKEIALCDIMDYIRKVSLDAELGPSTGAIVAEAKKRGIPVTRIGHESLVRLGYGMNSRLVESTLTDATSCISADISCNKQLTKDLLRAHRIPVPYGKVVYTEISAQMEALQIGFPVVVKPFDGNQGKGVHIDIGSPAEVKEAFFDAARFSNGIIIEEYITGRDYRILVVGGKVKAVAERIPAHVIGDGLNTIRELVARINLDPDRGEKHEKRLTRIRLDDIAVGVLKKRGMTPESIAAEGEIIYLRENGNLSTGGTAIDCTDLIHPDNEEIAIQAASAIGIDIAGIDIVAPDISKSILETGGAVIEVNTAPGIRMHLYPSVGKPRNVARDIVDMLFPTEQSKEFPIVSVTGTNGKTTVVRLIHHVLSQTGKTVGMTSTCGTFVGKRCIMKGDDSGPRSARTLLSNKRIEAAVLETARGGIVREGLGYDLADVGVITNITDDHLGLDGIETIENMTFVKSLVAEAVKSGGAVVLNAEDAATPAVLERVVASKIILFHKNAKTDEKYLNLNYTHVFADNGWLTICDGSSKFDIMELRDIPITFNGLIECNIENALAAAAALYALRIPLEQIRRGFQSFTDNAGRFNLFKLGEIYVMLDYGHNRAGFEQVIKVLGKLRRNRLLGVIGMPGDRQNGSIMTVGMQCAKAFDRLYVKEDGDLRGRAKGEVADIFLRSILDNGFASENVIVMDDELSALRQAVQDAKRGDMVVVFYENYFRLCQFLLENGATDLSHFSVRKPIYQKASKPVFMGAELKTI